jgi:hypothetical protein
MGDHRVAVEREESCGIERRTNSYIHIRTFIVMPVIPEHKDILGRDLTEECTVIVPDGNRSLKIGVVKKLHPKMVTVQVIQPGSFRGYSEKMIYPGDLLVTDDSRITMYMLKHSPQ